jgi:hypothetical protein
MVAVVLGNDHGLNPGLVDHQAKLLVQLYGRYAHFGMLI